MFVDHRNKVLVKLSITSRPQLCFLSRPKTEARPGGEMAWLTSAPAVMTNDPLPWCQPITTDHDPERAHLES